MKKLFRSLQAKYMLIIIVALILVQFAYLFSVLIMFNLDNKLQSETQQSFIDVEEQWHEDAKSIKANDLEAIKRLFEQWASEYVSASMYWINDEGNLVSSLNLPDNIPVHWSNTYTVSFMKERYGGDPFTVVAFVGEDRENGFVVFELPRSAFNSTAMNVYDKYGQWVVLIIGGIIALFIFVSYLFFRSIRKRLIQIQKAMSSKNSVGLPTPINIKKLDEIGQLEQTFNHMVTELTESKKREQAEEQLRRELIASLSHDLRTPLTKIRAQTYSISKSVQTEEDRKSVMLLESSIKQMDALIENLMAYSLLMADKYQLKLQQLDIIRFLREHLATWYSAFENANFDIDISLEGMQNMKWKADPIWLGRILDNIFQNVLRHASTGKYIGIKVETRGNLDVISISDKGPGMDHDSQEKGAGIGLTIVDMMVKGQHLSWSTVSSKNGLSIEIYRER